MGDPWEEQTMPETDPWVGASESPYKGRTGLSLLRRLPIHEGIAEAVGNMAVAAPIPMATTALGAAAGTVTMGPGAGTIAGGMIGGGAGEAINQELGITEKSDAAILLNTAAPVVGTILRSVKDLLKPVIAHILPSAGIPLQERAAVEAQKIVKTMAPREAANVLYGRVEQYNPPIDATAFRKSITDGIAEVELRLGTSSQKTSLLRFLNGKLEAVDGFENIEIPFKMMRSTQKELNAMIGAKDTGEDVGILKQLAKGIQQSFTETAASSTEGSEAVTVLREANKAFSKQQGQDALALVFEKSMPEEVGGIRTFSDTARKNIKKFLNVNEEIQHAYSKDEISSIKNALDSIGTLPGLPPSTNTLYGGMRYSGPAVAGAVLAPSMGIPTVAGAAAGMTIDLAIRKVVESPWGREQVIKMATDTGRKVSPEMVMTIASAIAGGMTGLVNRKKESTSKPAATFDRGPSSGLQRAFANQP